MQNEINSVAALVSQRFESPPLAYVHTFGCQQNVNDSEKIRGVLALMGYGFCDNDRDADLIIFNTCAVREHAEQKIFGNVGTLKARKKANPNLIIGLCGCMVQQVHIVEKIKTSYPYVDLVFGVNAIDTLPGMLSRLLAGQKKNIVAPAPVSNEINEDIPTRRDSSFRAYVPIMYGCNNFCTYCVVPYVRGRERSREKEAVYAEVKSLIESGYKDITLLGQNVNSYGGGLEEKVDFPDLLSYLCEIPGEFRLRFMTSHPKDATRKLIDTIAAHPQICTHLHLPVQAGSDRILELMNRNYTVDGYLNIINYAKEKIPGLTLSSDIIVGFPGETDEEFEGTMKLVEEVGYNQLFTFIYSKRVGTPAAEMADDTPRSTKVERLTRLSEYQMQREAELLKSYVGTRQRILVEGTERGSYKGRLENDRAAHFSADEDLTGTFVWVKVTGVRGSVLTAELD